MTNGSSFGMPSKGRETKQGNVRRVSRLRLVRNWHETDQLALLTKKALTAGQSFRTDGVTIDVGSAVMGGGFSIQVETIATDQLLCYGDAGVCDRRLR